MADGLLTIATPEEVRAVAATRGADGLLRMVKGDCPGAGCCGTIPCPPSTGFLRMKKCACNRSGSPSPLIVMTAALFRELTAQFWRKCITILAGASLGGGSPGVCVSVQADSERLESAPAGAIVISSAGQIPPGAGGFLGTCCDCCRGPALRTCSSSRLYYEQGGCCGDPDSGITCHGVQGPGSPYAADVCCGLTGIIHQAFEQLETWSADSTCTQHYLLRKQWSVSGTAAAVGTLSGSASHFEQSWVVNPNPPFNCIDVGQKFSYADARGFSNCTGYLDQVRSAAGVLPFIGIAMPGCKPKSFHFEDAWTYHDWSVTGLESPSATSVRYVEVYDRQRRLGWWPDQHRRHEIRFDVTRSPVDAVCSRRCASCTEKGPTGYDPGEGEPTGTSPFPGACSGSGLWTPKRRAVLVAGLREIRESRIASGGGRESGGDGSGGCAGCGSVATDDERVRIAAMLRRS